MKLVFMSAILALFAIVSGYSADSSVKVAVLGIESRIKTRSIDTETLTELLQTELFKQKVFIIVERAYLSKIIEEQKLQLSGLTESDVSRIGSLAGADKVITGSLSELSGDMILIVKMVNVKTGTIEIIEQDKAGNLNDLIQKLPDMGYRIGKRYRGETPGSLDQQPLLKVTAQDLSSEQKNENDNQVNNTTWRGFFPLQLSFVESLQIVPKDFLITGVALNIISGYNVAVFGVDVGFIRNHTVLLYGVQCGLLNTADKKMFGIQTGLLNNAHGDMFGLQCGLYNSAQLVRGMQVGLINYAETLQGVQIGLINTTKYGWLPFMIGINVSF